MSCSRTQHGDACGTGDRTKGSHCESLGICSKHVCRNITQTMSKEVVLKLIFYFTESVSNDVN